MKTDTRTNNTPIRSKGFLFVVDGFEYFTGNNGDVFRARETDPIDIHGFRSGARFESTPASLPLLKKVLGIK